MSRRPIVLSSDLLRLQNDGYDVDTADDGRLLVIRGVPYVNAGRAVQRGTLISKLELNGDVAVKPTDHTAFWVGEHPCHSDGRKIVSIENTTAPSQLGVEADFMFSAKADYRDYHHKMTTYIGRIAGEAAAVESGVTACTFPPIAERGGDAVFKYVDTASSRAGIAPLNDRLRGQRLGIAGLGGTGAYILDLVAKTAVQEIHLFDGDVFLQHNAFRSPGAASLAQLQEQPRKVAYLSQVYTNLHNGIVAHDSFLDASNLEQLDGLDFVFVCMDTGAAKRAVVDRLLDRGVPFVEVGMGINLTEQGLAGLVRVTTCTAQTATLARPHVSFSEDDSGNVYATNIQVAELNALNAALAVIQWKRHFSVYADPGTTYYAGYSLRRGEIVVEGVTSNGATDAAET